MWEHQKVSLFLAQRAIQRSGRGGLVLNVVIIALVFTNMILLPSIIAGSVNLYYEQSIDYETSDILIRPPGDERFITGVGALTATINRVPGVARSSPRYALGATLNHKAQSVSLPVTAFDPRDEVEVTKIHTRMKEGDFLGSGDAGAILLGGFLAGNADESKDIFDSLGGVEVGDSVQVIYSNGVVRDYRVKGIFETKSIQVDMMAFVTWEEMESVLGGPADAATEVLVRTTAPEEVDAVKTGLLGYGVREDVKTWREAMTTAVEDALESFAIINGISMLVSLIIAVVVIFIVIMIKTMNNRKQIGILKAIGIDRGIIIHSYVLQVLFICLLGTALGLLIVQGLMIYFTAHPMEFPDGDVVPCFEPLALLTNALWLFAASAVAGYIPAWRIANENILDAMRG
jgi:putative ABC transport system permease protein